MISTPQTDCSAFQDAAQPACTFDAAYTDNLKGIITRSTAELVRRGQAAAASDALVEGLSPDAEERRQVMTMVIEGLAAKQTQQVAAMVYGALRVLRQRGVRLDRILEDEIEEAVTEHTSRTVGLGTVADTLTPFSQTGAPPQPAGSQAGESVATRKSAS